MSSTSLQMFAFILFLFTSGSLLAQPSAGSDQATVDTVKNHAGSDFTTESVSGIDPRFKPVINRLAAEGWSRAWLEARFADKRTKFIPKMVVIKTRMPGRSSSSSGSSAYSWMYAAESDQACRDFLAKYSSIFDQAESKYGVDRQTIAALMRCETRHGSVTGSYHVFSVYASMSLMGESNFVNENTERARRELTEVKASAKYINSEVSRISSRGATRSKWAYRELVNLLKIDREGYTDAMGLYGSWAGAFGWSQFLPSSYLRRAVDGNGDGKIDLFNPNDAINSVANYLNKSGYTIGDNAKRRRAVRSYNPSTPYVESIIALADRVRSNPTR